VLHALLQGRHTLLLSNEILVETTRVLRYPRLQKLYAMPDEEIYDYAQFLQEASEQVVLGQPYLAPLSAGTQMSSAATTRTFTIG
jgi:hypothetical protein